MTDKDLTAAREHLRLMREYLHAAIVLAEHIHEQGCCETWQATSGLKRVLEDAEERMEALKTSFDAGTNGSDDA